MKDYSRKNYTDQQYRDWMRTPTSKSIFNQVLDQTIGLGEFSNHKSNKTSLGRAIARYMKQSEFKKPYEADQGFIQMENDWEGLPGLRLQFPRFDSPAIVPLGSIIAPPVVTIFDADHTGGWCREYDTAILITGTQPIYELTITFGEGASLSGIVGYGTNSVHCTLHVPNDKSSGFITIEASMISFEGIVGDSNVNVYEKDTCCAFHGLFKRIAQSGYFRGEDGNRYMLTAEEAVADVWNNARTAYPEGDCGWQNTGAFHSELEVHTAISLVSNPGDAEPVPPGPGTWQAYAKVERAYLRFERFTNEVHVATFKFLAENPDYWPPGKVSDPYIFCTYTGADDPAHIDCTEFGPAVTEEFTVNNDGFPPTEYELRLNQVGIDFMNAGGSRFLIMNTWDHEGIPSPPGQGDNIVCRSGWSTAPGAIRLTYNC
jgi:hypothetical protein